MVTVCVHACLVAAVGSVRADVVLDGSRTVPLGRDSRDDEWVFLMNTFKVVPLLVAGVVVLLKVG